VSNLKILNDIFYTAISEEELKEEILVIWRNVFNHSNISILDSVYEQNLVNLDKIDLTNFEIACRDRLFNEKVEGVA